MRFSPFVLSFSVILVAAPLFAAELPRLKVSDNRRFLVTEDGKPFFYLGDTAWELFHRLDRNQATKYLEDRAAKGFTVIQAVVLAELDGLHEPNPYGHTPLKQDDPTSPNEKYFEHVDWIVAKANALGLTIGMLPTWGDKWNKKWGVGPEIFTPENAKEYGRWLGERYKDRGIIWILGGDRPVETDQHRAIITAMAMGIRNGDRGRHLMTFHTWGGHGSAEFFHHEPWLDFNMRQNGHRNTYNGRYNQTLVDYQRKPTKPVIDGEPIYEGIPIDFKTDQNGYSMATDVRRALYWDLFHGAFGHTYGHNSVWQMVDPQKKPVISPLMHWESALNQPGAGQMQYGRYLIESRPFLSRIPDDSVIVPDKQATAVPGVGRARFVATRDRDGRYAMIYAPVGRAFRVNLDKLSGKQLIAWWFNPRTGGNTLIGTFPRQGTRSFSPPDSGELLDWILVLDDAAAKFPPPGQRN